MSREYTSEQSLEIDGVWYAGVDYKPCRVQLNEALSIFEDNLDEIKESCQKNIIHIVRDNPKPEETGSEILDEVRRDIWKLKLETDLHHYQRTIKRIQSIKEHKFRPRTGSITEADIERARDYPLDQLYDGRLQGPESGRRFGLCPFHSERTGSFCIHPDNRWSCFGTCSEHGDVIDFYKKLHGCDFVSAVKALTR